MTYMTTDVTLLMAEAIVFHVVIRELADNSVDFDGFETSYFILEGLPILVLQHAIQLLVKPASSWSVEFFLERSKQLASPWRWR